ncbi:hypothetical protein [Mesorhizobium cantuariense]|uniref:GCVT N-terminal domain-containing protein n=1 Tax=Mesorhizobium cantuariense TaxID=1300275 RepID=A0ABV7MT40_9HYPH
MAPFPGAGCASPHPLLNVAAKCLATGRRLAMDDIKFTTGLSTVADARVAFRGTPFVERTAPLNQNALWMRWDRNMVVDSYSDMVEELAAIRTRVAMGDMSPLSKYVIAGPDAEKLMDTLIPRDMKKLQVGQIYYAPWCDENGHVVGDGLVFRMDEATFRARDHVRQHDVRLRRRVPDARLFRQVRSRPYCRARLAGRRRYHRRQLDAVPGCRCDLHLRVSGGVGHPCPGRGDSRPPSDIPGAALCGIAGAAGRSAVAHASAGRARRALQQGVIPRAGWDL